MPLGISTTADISAVTKLQCSPPAKSQKEGSEETETGVTKDEAEVPRRQTSASRV
jgi:hypothetical protein